MLRSLLLFALQKEPREVEQDMDEESRRRRIPRLVHDWCMTGATKVEMICGEFLWLGHLGPPICFQEKVKTDLKV